MSCANKISRKQKLTIKLLCEEAGKFSKKESSHHEPSIFGVTDGKAIGNYLERKFQDYLRLKYEFIAGNPAKGIDFPRLNVDIKTTSIKQPQSSSPFKSARQKIYGLGYSLLIFAYEKTDNSKTKKGNLRILHTIFISKDKTADYQTTKAIREILDNDGNEDDLIALMMDKNLPVDDIQAGKIAAEIIKKKPKQGYLTISNALQWRLQYSRVIEKAGLIPGIKRLG